MRNQMRGALSEEITRKQFLQYLGAALLMVFGLENLVSLLTGRRLPHNMTGSGSVEGRHGFGSSKFGV